jgi:hypothetical protein
MGAFWRRLTACERRTQRLLQIIANQSRQIRALQQQLFDLRGTV